MRWTLTAAVLFTSLPAYAGQQVHRLAWEVVVDGQPIGTREATVTVESTDTGTTRIVEAWTTLDAKPLGAPWAWKQRLTVVGDEGPASFHAVMAETGAKREVQGRLDATGWTVTVADGRSARTFDAPASRIQLTTADLLDPMTTVPLSSFDEARILSVETGDVWSGPVTALPPTTVAIKGTQVMVRGWSWESPEGTSRFWYDADGWLVKFETKVLGRPVTGTLTNAPPQSADAFSVKVQDDAVETLEL